ncbi:MAG: hypothetical protein K8R54_06100 [Bacteroidales bacterium]|nr:hypothetical protein [Bacteroidales bacterium]
MNISIDISYYPLNVEFVQPILDFIHRLQDYKELEISRNGMSTQIFGEYDDVMQILTKEIKKSFEIPSSVFILKIVNSDLQ